MHCLACNASLSACYAAPAGRQSVVIPRAVSLEAAQETARKAAAVREQLKNSAQQRRLAHEHNVQIAELQQKVAQRAHKAAQHQQQGAQKQQAWQQQPPAEEQRNGAAGDTTADTQPDASVTGDSPDAAQQLRGKRLFAREMQLQRQQQQQPRGTQRPRQRTLQQNPEFYEVLQGVELLARSPTMYDWQQAAWQCRQVLVPAVCGSQQAAAAWRVINSLAGRRLDKYHSRQLGSAVAELTKVCLANQDASVLQLLLASGSRFSIGPRQLRDLVAVAAAAGADSFMLNGLLELAPPCQLSSRAFFAAVSTSLNRRHYQEAQAALQLLQDMGLPLSPGLQRLQQQVAAGLRGGAGR